MADVALDHPDLGGDMRCRRRHRASQARLDRLNHANGGRVGRGRVNTRLHRARGHDGDGPSKVVKQHHGAGHHHHHVGNRQIVVGHVGQVLHRAHQVVAEEAHGTAPERHLVGRRGNRRVEHHGLHCAKWIGWVELGLGAVVPTHDQTPALGADNGLGIDAEHRVPANALPLLSRLEQEARTTVTQLQHGAHRRLAVGEIRVNHLHLKVLRGERPYLVQRRGHRDARPGGARGYVDAKGGHPCSRLRDASSSATSAKRTSSDCHSTTRWYSRSALS